MTDVHVLLSTFNGAPWLPGLLTSLQQQSFTAWQLVIRDDGSTDGTIELLRQWCRRYPDKVFSLEISEASEGNVGCQLSFSRLMAKSLAHSTVPYLMFCDQDDIWLPEKITLTIDALQILERQFQDKPLLVHTDLILTDQHLQITAASFWQKRRFNPQQKPQDYYLHNIVSGCAAAFNRRAALLAYPIPKQAIQHDHWLALVCARFGRIKAIEQPLILYRQHANNLVGAKAHRILNRRVVRQRLAAWSAQAAVFFERFGEELQHKEDRRIKALASLPAENAWKKRRILLQNRLFKPGLMATIALWLFA